MGILGAVAVDLKLYLYIAASCARGCQIRLLLVRSNGNSAGRVLCLWQAASKCPILGQQKISMHFNVTISRQVHMTYEDMLRDAGTRCQEFSQGLDCGG